MGIFGSSDSEEKTNLLRQAMQSRRQLLTMGTAAGLGGFLTSAASAAPSQKEQLGCCEANVRTFGAIGDGQSDDTAAFQRAMDSLHRTAGGMVYAPPGKYLFRESLEIPDGVSLRGSFGCAPSHTGIRDRGQAKPGDDGTVLLVIAGRGQEDGKPFITINTNSSVVGLTIHYPEQVADDVPLAYPWTIAMRGKNPAAFDLELLNPYQGIDASQNERHNIRNITGQPLRRGIWVDAIYDIGRIENVHFNPWWNSHSRVYQWQTENGEAFIFGRADWEYVLNTFCFGYHVGYKFVPTPTGECNGNFLGIGADDCNRSILVEQSAVYGLLIANGEFTSFHGNDPTTVEVLGSNHGVVRFSNCAFWGPCHQIAKINGEGTVGFSDCTFVEWGNEDRAAIRVGSGSVLVSGCEFRQNKPHISLGERVDRAVIAGNLFAGRAQIRNLTTKDAQIGLNSSF
jgi:Pectate lyase superfamily protein